MSQASPRIGQDRGHGAPSSARGQVLPRLAPGASLVDEVDGARLQLASGERVRLNASAATLLARCDGRQALESLARQSNSREDTLAFLTVALQLGWLVNG